MLNEKPTSAEKDPDSNECVQDEVLQYHQMTVDTPPPNPNYGPGDPPSRKDDNPFRLPSPVESEYELSEDGSGFNINYGEVGMSPMLAIETQHAMQIFRAVAVFDSVSKMYGGGDMNPMQLFGGLHYFTPVFTTAGHHTFTVRISRTVKIRNVNRGLVVSSAMDMLCLISIHVVTQL